MISFKNDTKRTNNWYREMKLKIRPTMKRTLSFANASAVPVIKRNNTPSSLGFFLIFNNNILFGCFHKKIKRKHQNEKQYDITIFTDSLWTITTVFGKTSSPLYKNIMIYIYINITMDSLQNCGL